MSVSQAHFQNAHHFQVHNGQFTNIINAHDAVSTILWPCVASGAIFDSGARYAAGKCHPGTRTKVIRSITDWTKELDARHCLLWLYGAAGAGKSALAHTICELLRELYPNTYGGSFFFASGNTDRGNAHKLFATLAFQLATHFPPMRNEINAALAHDPSLPTKSMEVQLFSLVIQPLLRCQDSLSHIPVLIIDGLDECAETEGSTQSDIVTLISKYMIQSNPRLRFMITSRPEYWIRDVFGTPQLTSITLPLSLRDDVDADKDIKAYLIHGFEKIRVANRRSMGSVVPPWPSSDIINRLVYDASGQYVYAATVLKFVGKSSRFHNPQEQLRIITSSGPHRASAFSELDALYAKILSAYPRWQTMKRVLAAHLVHKTIPIFAIQTALRINPDEFLMVLDALSSLVNITKKKPPRDSQDVLLEEMFGDMHTGCDTISFCHRSFGEFLRDQTRSGSFYIGPNLDQVPDEILNNCTSMICRNIEQKYRVSPFVSLNTTLVMYICMMELILPSTSCCNLTTLPKLSTDIAATLDRFDPSGVAEMKSLFYFMTDTDYLKGIVAVISDRYRHAKFDNTEQHELLDELENACQQLNEAINLACKRAFCVLPLCTDFEATPALVYLLEYHLGDYCLPIAELSDVAGVSDVKSALKKHGCVALRVRYSETTLRWTILPSSLPRLFDNGEKPVWRTEGVWRDLRVMLACKRLKAVLHHCRRHTREQTRVDGLLQYFETRKISDICSVEYFQSPSNIFLLSAVTDLASWFHWHYPHFLSSGDTDTLFWPDQENTLHSIFRWTSRQLSNPQTVLLLQAHAEALRETLNTFMNDLFEYNFRQPLIECCNRTTLCAYQVGHGGGKSVKISVLPLPSGLDEQIMDNGYASDAHYALDSDPRHWQRFHDENFGNLSNNEDTSVSHLIVPSRWHPHLAFGLLKLLVSFCYSRVYPKFQRGWPHEDNDIKSFPYLIQCMPYAHPTPENLDALRAIVYLYPQINGRWTPPEGLWPLIVEFLHKYDRSILSAEELDLFVKWLNSDDHADINTYVNQ